MAKANQSGNASRPNRDEKRKPNQPRYQPVEQADDEEIAQTQRSGPRGNPADQVAGRDMQASGEGQTEEMDEDTDEADDEEWMDEDGEIRAEDDGTDEDEPTAGQQSRRSKRGGDSPRP